MKRTHTDGYTIAMSADTGRIVFLKNGRAQGSLERPQSVEFAKGIIGWEPPALRQAMADMRPQPRLSVVPRDPVTADVEPIPADNLDTPGSGAGI